MTEPIRFDDGAAYERYMGVWSRLVGEEFLDWLAVPPNARWLDVGCGNGAFTERIAERCAPKSIHGIDPSEAQIAFARSRSALRSATLEIGDAQALPFEAYAFDVAVMPLVIFFVPDPAQGVAEMARVVRRGGIVAAYGWDLAGGGFPYEVLHTELRGVGAEVPTPPSPNAANFDSLEAVWTGAGLAEIATRAITVERTFGDFEDYWTLVRGGPSVARLLATLSPTNLDRVKQCVRERLPADATGRIRYSARAHAIRGTVR